MKALEELFKAKSKMHNEILGETEAITEFISNHFNLSVIKQRVNYKDKLNLVNHYLEAFGTLNSFKDIPCYEATFRDENTDRVEIDVIKIIGFNYNNPIYRFTFLIDPEGEKLDRFTIINEINKWLKKENPRLEATA